MARKNGSTYEGFFVVEAVPTAEIRMEFRHEIIDPDPPAGELDVCLPVDLTGNGRDDVIVGGKDPEVFWYENHEDGWERHHLATGPVADDERFLEAGGVLVDVTGNERMDVVVGQPAGGGPRAFWFEQPEDPREEWDIHLLTDRYHKYHDQAVGDLDGDGEDEILFSSQVSELLFYVDIPADPFQEPWPETCFHTIATGLEVEGLQVVDIDGDGHQEAIAGPNVFHRQADGRWEREQLSDDWDQTRVQVADIDDDGELEVLLAEGESPAPHLPATEPGRVGYLDPPQWTPVILRAGLYCPHSFELADFTDDGRLDIYVGEMGLGEHDSPRHFVFEHRGNGEFEEHLIARDLPTHEGKVANLGGDGRHDIVVKPYAPERRVDALIRVE